MGIEDAKQGLLRNRIKEYWKKKNKFQIKGLGISRQRFWGCPIPIIYREDGEVLAVEENDLPVKLPEVKNFGTSSTTLSNNQNWKETVCSKTE